MGKSLNIEFLRVDNMDRGNGQCWVMVLYGSMINDGLLAVFGEFGIHHASD